MVIVNKYVCNDGTGRGIWHHYKRIELDEDPKVKDFKPCEEDQAEYKYEIIFEDHRPLIIFSLHPSLFD